MDSWPGLGERRSSPTASPLAHEIRDFENPQCAMEATMPAIKILTMSAILLSLAACGDTWGQRAVTGGAIGSGAVIGGVTGVGVLPGALIGGAVGAGVGAATTPSSSD
jgi:osmotically inducible lipoprotein OsmB